MFVLEHEQKNNIDMGHGDRARVMRSGSSITPQRVGVVCRLFVARRTSSSLFVGVCPWTEDGQTVSQTVRSCESGKLMMLMLMKRTILYYTPELVLVLR